MRRALPLALVVALLAPIGAPAQLRERRVPKPKHGRKHRGRHKERVRPPERVRSVKPPARPPASAPRTPPRRPPRRPPAPTPLARVQVVAREFSLTLSRHSLPAGRAAVELVNYGQDPHDLRVERADAPATGFSFALARPRTVASQKLDLSAGEWKLYCTLPGHEALGMSARVTVTG